MASTSKSSRQEQHSTEQSKLSSLRSHVSKGQSKKLYKNMYTDSSDSDSDVSVPTLPELRRSEKIQKAVDARLRELELLQGKTGNESTAKIKSKRGGPVEILVKHKVAWPHEAILGGANRTRLTYDQLSLTQWVQGFCKNVLDEKDEHKREQMITYMSELMEDATDFGWQGAKAAHAVLCFELERGTVSWDDSVRIERIRRAHAQKHSNMAKNWGRAYESSKKPWFCKFFQQGNCKFDSDHEVGGKLHRHICVFCVKQGKVIGHAEKDCALARKNVSKNVSSAVH